ncbi:MAG TPA: Gfo/Idh/MocA family oxidoreductase [Candidatus Eisenbacteria bacterium]|nr:Gfo/Idh/MocA family oxidoreductase [Candidatus Eisenbacteria bacterium]
MIRVGVIGCGKIARAHVPYVREYKGATIVAVCDSDPRQGERLAAHFKIDKVYDSPAKLLEQQKPDVVHILTPPQTHADLAVAAMEAGSHVLVEKPMAISVEEAARMVATARRTDRRLCVDHNRLFDPVMLEAKAMVASGAIGEIVGVDAFQGYIRVTENGDFEAGWVSKLPGGVLQNIAPHPISLLLGVMPEARPVSVVRKTTGFCPKAPVEEVRVTFEGDRGLGMLTLSLSPQPYLNYLTIYGSQATLQVNLNNNTLLVFRDRRLPKLLAKSWFNIDQALQLLNNTVKSGAQVLSGKMRFYPGMGNLIRRFYRSIENGGPVPVSGEEGKRVVEILDLICGTSMANGLAFVSAHAAQPNGQASPAD